MDHNGHVTLEVEANIRCCQPTVTMPSDSLEKFSHLAVVDQQINHEPCLIGMI